MATALYPGSFDPITFGHLDVIGRAAGLFDRLVVGVLVNPRKSPMLALEERMAAIEEAVAEELGEELAGRVETSSFDGLTVDFARRIGAVFIVRGLRAVSDFESELQMAHTNRKLAPEVDTLFLMTSLEHAYLSSSLVKEIAAFGGDVGNQYVDFDRPQNVGHFMLAMKPDLFIPREEYEARMDALIERVRSCPRAEGFDEVMVPGEPEARQEAIRLRQGIPYGPGEVSELRKLAEDRNVPFFSLSAAPLSAP
jgi:pantetheine-phosphate adenylyltransferase